MQLGNQSQVPAKLLIRELFRWSWSKSERNPIVLGVDTIPVSGRSAFPWGKPTRASSPSSLPSKQQMTHHNEGARRGGPKVYLCTSISAGAILGHITPRKRGAAAEEN